MYPIQTSDTCFATTILCLGGEFIDAYTAQDEKVVFMLRHEETVETFLTKYVNREIKVVPQRYSYYYKFLKTKITEVKLRVSLSPSESQELE